MPCPRPTASQAAGAPSSGTTSWSTSMRPCAACSRTVPKTARRALVGEGGVRVAEHRRRPAAQGRRVDRQGRPGGAAEVHQAPALGEHQRRGRARDAGERVDDDVGGALGTPRAAARPGRRRRRPRAGRPRHPRRARWPAAGRRPSGRPRRRGRHRAGGPPARRPGRRPRRRRARARSRPGGRAARPSSTSQAATADRPSAATVVSGRSASTRTASAAAATASSASPPSPGAMPAVVGNHTRRPTSSGGPARTTPTACTPGTYGSAGAPK